MKEEKSEKKKEKDPRRTGRPIKRCKVDEAEFRVLLEKMRQGEITQKEVATMCGMDRNTLSTRIKSYLRPDIYGDIPDGFFEGYISTTKLHGVNELPKL